jgi:phage terminase large subunit-like protein
MLSALRPFTLEHFEGWARRLVLDTGDPWELVDFQRAFVDDLFSARRENWLILPEGSGKTTLTAGLALYGLRFAEDALIPIAASSRDQARIMYRQAQGFLRRSRLDDPGFSFEAFDGYRRIDLRGPGKTKRGEVLGSIEVHAADAGTGDGIIPYPFCILDELHRHRTLDLYEVWRGKLEKRGAQMVAISTAGEVGGSFEQTRTMIRQETPLTHSFPGFVKCESAEIVFHEWALEEGADPDDMEAVKRCNPLPSLTVEMLASKRRSPTMSPAHWARFVCGKAVRSTSAAITEMEWANAATVEPLPAGDWWVGLDVGWKWDTTALVPFVWVDSEHRRFGPATVLEPPRDGNSLHPDVLKRALMAIMADVRVSTVVMDISNANDIAAWMSDELGLTVVDRAQTNAPLTEDYERFMEALRQGWIRHSNDAAFRRHALNAVARLLPGGGARFDRPVASRSSAAKQDSRVVDALSAAAMVHSYAVESRDNQVWVG